MTFLLGLTGSIGMGKSTTANMFRDMGISVWDADKVVHDLYEKNSSAIPIIESQIPGIIENGAVNRDSLRLAIQHHPPLLKKIEHIIHPLVWENRNSFISQNKHEPLLVFDIPLLFETGSDQDMDATLVVETDYDTQRSRVLNRDGMTEEIFQSLLKRQMPNQEKASKANYVIRTDDMDQTRHDVASLVNKLTQGCVR